MNLSDYVVFGVYIVFSILLGIKAGGKQKSLKVYLLADQQMPSTLIAVSILASLFSGISFLGAPAEVFNHNLIYLWVIIGYWIATPIATTVFLPFFFKLNFYTAYEYLEHRFDLSLRRLSSIAFLFRGVLWLALALYAPSLVISEMMAIPLWISIITTGLCTLLYTTLGGMRAVIYTDVMQFSIFFLVMFIILIAAVFSVPGGLHGIWELADAGGKTQFVDFSLSPDKRMTFWGALLGGCIISLSGLVTDQVSVQRYLTAPSLRESQKALWIKLYLTVPFIGMFYIAGLVLYSFYQSHPEMMATLSAPDRLVPHFVSRQLPSPFSGLLIAAILAATMSTISAGINSLTTAMLMDFTFTKKALLAEGDVVEQSRIRLARWVTVSFGVAIILLSLWIGQLGSLVEASNKIAGFLGGPMLGIFCLGVCSRRANSRGTLIGALSGFLVVAYVGVGTATSFIWYALIGFVTVMVVGELASLFFAPPSEQQLSFSRRRRVTRTKTTSCIPTPATTDQPKVSP